MSHWPLLVRSLLSLPHLTPYRANLIVKSHQSVTEKHVFLRENRGTGTWSEVRPRRGNAHDGPLRFCLPKENTFPFLFLFASYDTNTKQTQTSIFTHQAPRLWIRTFLNAANHLCARSWTCSEVSPWILCPASVFHNHCHEPQSDPTRDFPSRNKTLQFATKSGCISVLVHVQNPPFSGLLPVTLWLPRGLPVPADDSQNFLTFNLAPKLTSLISTDVAHASSEFSNNSLTTLCTDVITCALPIRRTVDCVSWWRVILDKSKDLTKVSTWNRLSRSPCCFQRKLFCTTVTPTAIKEDGCKMSGGRGPWPGGMGHDRGGSGAMTTMICAWITGRPYIYIDV